MAARTQRYEKKNPKSIGNRLNRVKTGEFRKKNLILFFQKKILFYFSKKKFNFIFPEKKNSKFVSTKFFQNFFFSIFFQFFLQSFFKNMNSLNCGKESFNLKNHIFLSVLLNLETFFSPIPLTLSLEHSLLHCCF